MSEHFQFFQKSGGKMKYYKTLESEDDNNPLHLNDSDFNINVDSLEAGVDLSKSHILAKKL